MAKTTTSNTRPENARSGTVLIETDTKRLIVYDGKFWNAFDSEFRIATKQADDLYSVYTTNYTDSTRVKGWTGLHTNTNVPSLHTSNTDGGSYTLWFCTSETNVTQGHMLMAVTDVTQDLSNSPTVSVPANEPPYGFIGIKGSTLYMRSFPLQHNTWWSTRTYNAGKNLSDGQWHNLTVTYHMEFQDVLGGVLYLTERVYVDGVYIGQRDSNSNYGHPTMWYGAGLAGRQLVLGGPNWSTSDGLFPGLRGWFGDFAIWHTRLSDYDIQEIYQSRGAHLFADQLDPNRFYLKHWWKMGDEQPTAIAVNRSQDYIFDSAGGDLPLYTFGNLAGGTDTQPAIAKPIFTTFTASSDTSRPDASEY